MNRATYFKRFSSQSKLRTYRSHCKLCLSAIYSDQPAAWLTNPMGLSHKGCVKR